MGKKPCVNHPFKLLMLVEGSYCWKVVGGRTISPCPHAHSTSRLLSTRRQENHKRGFTPFLFILTHMILPGFYSRSELGAVFFHPRFPLSICGLCVVFSPVWAENGIYFSIVAHPHTGKNALCLTQRNSFSVGLTQPIEGAVLTVIHIFHREESGVFFHPYIWIWCKFPSRTGWEADFPSPFAVCVSLLGGFVVQDGQLFSPTL